MPLRGAASRFARTFGANWLAACAFFCGDVRSEAPAFGPLSDRYESEIRPILKQFCLSCHSAEKREGDFDLERFHDLSQVRADAPAWRRVQEMIEDGEMPPEEAAPLEGEDRIRLTGWVRAYLEAEGRASAGDPGPVVLRRLNNAEYAYTVRDLAGVPSLDPARDFPADGAAGEGFTNAGQALAMSPSLVTKYLDAAKDLARHAVLLPDGFRFSASTTRSDWTNEILARIREIYGRYTDSGGGETIDLQGIVFDTNQGGRLPIEKYLSATIEERDAFSSGAKSMKDAARERGLNAKYLGSLWGLLSNDKGGGEDGRSLLIERLRAEWRESRLEDAGSLAASLVRLQKELWRFSSVGHIGKAGGPTAWMTTVDPLAVRQEVRLPLSPPPDGEDVLLYLAAGDAGDGGEHDFAVWERPRLTWPGRPDVLLRDVGPLVEALVLRRDRVLAETAKCLSAAAEARGAADPLDVAELAHRHDVDFDSLKAWLDYLGVVGGAARIGVLADGRAEGVSGYDFVQGWAAEEALSFLANSSDQEVRIPGRMRPHSIAVHPSPTLAAVVGWRSPESMQVRISGSVEDVHPECGNGVEWVLELRRGPTRQRLASGSSQGGASVSIGPVGPVGVSTGDVVSLAIRPRDGNHACDLTSVELSLTSGERDWSLTRDVSPNILDGNPHADAHRNAAVWHFFSESASESTGSAIPPDSALARWLLATTDGERASLAQEVQGIAQSLDATSERDSPNEELRRQLRSLGGPLLSSAVATESAVGAEHAFHFGLAPSVFGRHPEFAGGDASKVPVDSASLCVAAPSVVEVRLPGDLAAGAEFVAGGFLHPVTGREGSVQLWASTTKPEHVSGLRGAGGVETQENGSWTSNSRRISFATPVLVAEGGDARRRMLDAFDAFRRWFPPALCYTKIVPVDEVVTLTLYHREDEPLTRLMLDDAETAELNRLWEELHYVSRDALTLVDAYQQLLEYASQDADPKVFEPLRAPIERRAREFQDLLAATEPAHVDALAAFAGRAYRRPLTVEEDRGLRALYAELREQDLSHEEAFRWTLAKVLASPTFLYRVERPAAGASQGPVSDYELATRLSYFLWSSCPDEALLEVAGSGRLHEPQALVRETRRMLRDDRVRRLATEFACQWLQIRDFEERNEKSERRFPTFAGLRGAMFEESVRFFQDLFQNNGSVLGLLDADFTYLNEDLAAHYGVPGVEGPEWRRVEGVRRYARGGILTLATTLSTQSGASRTSPVLRGNWLSEVVLGERSPRPPKGVPPLADEAPEGLTERRLVELHSRDPACAKCHARIDPFGFALEGYDAIGRFRATDANGLPIDAATTLPDGTRIDGVDGLREYLSTTRREAYLRQFNRKLLGYALGRAVMLSDEPLLESMREALAANDFRFWSAVEVLVQSRPFCEIRGEAQEGGESEAR